jgi:hypothetical protein
VESKKVESKKVESKKVEKKGGVENRYSRKSKIGIVENR